MKQVIRYVADYFRDVQRTHLVVTTLIITLLIYFNYHFHLNSYLSASHIFLIRFSRNWLLFGCVFASAWLIGMRLRKRSAGNDWRFYLLLAMAPAVFAVKVSLQMRDITAAGKYLDTVLQWPLKCAVTLLLTFLLWRINGNGRAFAGLSFRNLSVRPYLILLLLMCPLLLMAGTSADFQAVYPKLQLLHESLSAGQKIFFELCYGLDFFTIELFFRGFLVLAFIKYGGIDAMLPMAAFYCTIHFGKPLAECISSYLGGLVLGAIVYNTRSIWGGLIVHLGIAWIMEIIGVVF